MTKPAAEKPEDAFPLTFPEAEQAFVKEVYAAADTIIEYGSGGSTILAAELGKPCLSVESDRGWSARLNDTLNQAHDGAPSARVVHVNIGPTKAWGFPRTDEAWNKYWRYPMQIWDQSELTGPDVVLIDGRMRPACFAATLMHIRKPTQILFDDYAHRKKYHRVERLLKPDRIVGRMAVFQATPDMLGAQDFRTVIPWFSDLF